MRPLEEMPSHRKGDYTEAVVVAEFKRRGIPVSTPVGDNERYDFVVETDDGFHSIQIKTATFEGDGVTIRGVSQHTNGSGNVYKQYDGDVDFLVGYCHEIGTMYLIPEHEIGSRIFLRTEAGKQSHRTTNWAEEYEFDRNWPPEAETRPDDDEYQLVRRLEERDIPVHRPTTDRSYDILLETPDGEHLRAVTTPGYLNDGRVRFDGKGAIRPDDTDLVLVHCDDLDALYLVRRDEYDVSISLRVEPPERPNSRTNPAEEYEFDERWPDVAVE